MPRFSLRWLGRWDHALPVGVLLVNALLMVAPSLPTLGQAPMGDAHVHPVDSTWLYAITADALFRWPPTLHTYLYAWPEGWDITRKFVDIANASLVSPFTLALGPLLAHDLFLIGMVCAAGWAAYALGFGVTGRKDAALVAGILYADMDPLFFTLRWGEDDVSTVWLLPAWLALLLWARRWVSSGRLSPLRAGFVCGVSLGLVGWFNSYYLLFNVGVTLLVVIVGWREARWGPRSLGAWLAGLGIAFAIVWGPRSLLGVQPWVARVRAEYYASTFWGLVFAPPGVRLASFLDVSGLLNPFSPLRTVHAVAKESAREGVVYLGLLPLALAVLGTFRSRVPHRLLLGLVGVAGFLLALGTYVRSEGALVTVAGYNIPGPWALLCTWVRYFDRVKHPFRFVDLTFLAVAVLGGAGVAWLSDHWRGRAREAVLVASLTLCVGERLWASPGLAPLRPTPIPLPAALGSLPVTPRQPAVLPLPLDLPFRPDDLELNRFHRWAQIAGHHRPLFMSPWGQWLQQDVPEEKVTCALIDLAGKGVGLIVLVTDFAAWSRPVNGTNEPWELETIQRLTRQVDPVRRNLRQKLEPIHEDAGIEIYQIPHPESFRDFDHSVCRARTPVRPS